MNFCRFHQAYVQLSLFLACKVSSPFIVDGNDLTQLFNTTGFFVSNYWDAKLKLRAAKL